MSKFREIFRGKARYVKVRAEKEAPEPKREVPDGLWTKCDQCREMLFNKDLERNLYVCVKCGHHFRISGRVRLAQLVDDLSAFEEFDASLRASDPLNFPQYKEKLARDREKTGNLDAIITGAGPVGGIRTVLIVMDFTFMGGSMGSVVGERVTRAFERATELRLPVVAVSASGGARMQEGILSLMQMQKTVAAVEKFSRTGLLYISVLTDSTTAGVFGSFASLGDINLAEPGATIGFAGQRVIEETIRKAIPPNLQKAETVYANGFIDRIVPRPELKGEIVKLLTWHGHRREASGAGETSPVQRPAAATPVSGAEAAGAEKPPTNGQARIRVGRSSSERSFVDRDAAGRSSSDRSPAEYSSADSGLANHSLAERGTRS